MDRGDEVIVGVNRYRMEDEEPFQGREIDNTAVRATQVAKLKRVRRQRDPALVDATLSALKAAAESGGSLLEACVNAARARATLGEISDTLRQVFGEHRSQAEVVGQVYGAAYGDEPELRTLRERLAQLREKAGAAPRILVAKLGQDGHDRGARVIASAFGDLGFDVTVGPLFQTPAEAAELAVAGGVQVVGVSSLAAGHKTLLPELVEALRARGGGEIIVVCGGVIPQADYAFLFENGVAAVFGPGTPVLDAAGAVLDLIEGRRRNA